jgi:dipeptidyl aminopeptidase/acylaminoacyl peptidase
MRVPRVHRPLILTVLLLEAWFTGQRCGATKRTLTPQDEIGLSHFGNPYSGHPESVFFSPDGRYFVVTTERGLLLRNKPESVLRVYSSDGVRKFLLLPDKRDEPEPIWVLKSSTYKEGPIITSIRWLADSASIAFLLKTPSGLNQLFVAKLKTRGVNSLTPKNQDVTAFDIHDDMHFVYSVLSPAIRSHSIRDQRATSIVGTGRPLDELLFPDDLQMLSQMYERSELWAVVDGRRFPVKDQSSHQILELYLKGQEALVLSPNGRYVVTARAVGLIPPTWEGLYPPPASSSVYRVRAGQQDLDSLAGTRYVSEYVLVDLVRGTSKSLTKAPMGEAAGWYGFTTAAWSADGRLVVLSNTFLRSEGDASPSRSRTPCVAVVDLQGDRSVCLDKRQRDDNENYITEGVEFLPGNGTRVRIKFYKDGSLQCNTYVQKDHGSWELQGTVSGFVPADRLLDVTVKECFDSPPVLLATDETSKISRVIWDPNPQLKDLELSEVSVFRWKDQTGLNWVGGLYKPIGYVRGHAYPLVIQTHGFHEDQFQASGVFPTGFAAQQLAAAGFVVLQVRDCHGRATPEEGPCNVAGYEAAVHTLADDGIVDPEQVGIIGFSRTCYYVMEALTVGAVHFKAASITDGVNVGYLQYITSVDDSENAVAREADAMNGGAPFGNGLQQWLKKSPEFNVDKVKTPLQVVAAGRAGVLFMWEPYAALRYLNKPVDLVVLNSSEHVLTNPKARIISQGGTVDWFRFWLKGEEDTDPAKVEQYARWRRLRERNVKN